LEFLLYSLLIIDAFSYCNAYRIASAVEKFLRLDQKRLLVDYGFLAMKKRGVSANRKLQLSQIFGE